MDNTTLFTRWGILLLEGASPRLPSLIAKLIAKIYYPNLPKGVRVFGWDNMKAHKKAGSIAQAVNKFNVFEGADEALAKGSSNFLEFAQNQAARKQELMNGYDRIAIDQRNQSLVQQIQRMQERFPGKRILFVAGKKHLNGQLAQDIGTNNRFAFVQTKTV